jgi:hypothetical protein
MVSHKQTLLAIEEFLNERRLESSKEIRQYINRDDLDEADVLQLQMAQCNQILIEQIGNIFFNWE